MKRNLELKKKFFFIFFWKLYYIFIIHFNNDFRKFSTIIINWILICSNLELKLYVLEEIENGTIPLNDFII